jgi:hypothetical protein
MVIARDPDIPAGLERVFFTSSGMSPSRAPGERFRLNGADIGAAAAPLPWQPGSAGRYELALVDGEGHIEDRIHFMVRGSGAQEPEPEPELTSPVNSEER